MKLFDGRVSQCVDYVPVRYEGKWACELTTVEGEKFLDKDLLTGKAIEFETEKQAKEYCSSMMDLVRVLNESKANI